MMQEITKTNLLILSGSIALIGAVGQVFSVNLSPYVFSVGALGLIILSFITMQQLLTDDFRIKRLYRINFITSLFLALAAYCMFISSGLWVIAVLIYAVNAIYISYRV